MASTTRGTAILKWGTYLVAGYIVNDSELDISGEEFVLDDEDGQNKTHITNFGLKDSVTLNFVPLTATTPPVIDSLLTYNGVTAPVLRLVKSNAKRNVEIWRVTLSRVPGVSYV